jgi:murein DD-endopeptidase MepM/ murein hydrolase activator NlpD
VPRRRRTLGRLALAALVALATAAAAAPGGAADLGDAKARQRSLQRQLDEATRALARLDTEREWAAESLAVARDRVGGAQATLEAARQALGVQVAALYKAGGTRPLSSLLTASTGAVVDRMEFETIMVGRQLDAAADAKVAYDAYQEAIREVQAALARTARVERRAKALAAALAKRFEAAKQLTDRLSGFGRTVLVDGRFVACPVSPPYSYTDTWGAARSGGRSHKGTDIMNPWGNKVHAYVDGVVSRQTTSALGGISLYLQGADGNEYYYAHLSSYASHVGQQVKAGELIAYNGQTGNARFTAPHVHFEVHPGGGSPVNPYPWVRRACG